MTQGTLFWLTIMVFTTMSNAISSTRVQVRNRVVNNKNCKRKLKKKHIIWRSRYIEGKL